MQLSAYILSKYECDAICLIDGIAKSETLYCPYGLKCSCGDWGFFKENRSIIARRILPTYVNIVLAWFSVDGIASCVFFKIVNDETSRYDRHQWPWRPLKPTAMNQSSTSGVMLRVFTTQLLYIERPDWWKSSCVPALWRHDRDMVIKTWWCYLLCLYNKIRYQIAM